MQKTRIPRKDKYSSHQQQNKTERTSCTRRRGSLRKDKYSSHLAANTVACSNSHRTRIFDDSEFSPKLSKMGLKVNPPYPTQWYVELLDNCFKIFDDKYCLVEENNFRISQSLFKELDNIANVLIGTRDKIIAAVGYLAINEVHQVKMDKLCYQMMKLEHIQSAAENPVRKLNDKLIQFFDERINMYKMELDRLDTTTALNKAPKPLPKQEAEEVDEAHNVESRDVQEKEAAKFDEAPNLESRDVTPVVKVEQGQGVEIEDYST